MKNVQKIDLGLTGYDELFANDEERKVNKLPRIFDIPISEIDDFPDHPFKVKIDEDMDQLVQSIKERGIITPVTLRPKEDVYNREYIPSHYTPWTYSDGNSYADPLIYGDDATGWRLAIDQDTYRSQTYETQ